jgi:hypothetical protein
VDIRFIRGVAVTTPDPAQSGALHVTALRLPLAAAGGDDPFHSRNIPWAEHVGALGGTAQPRSWLRRVEARA